MAKQLMGNIAWEHTHTDGRFNGFHYCIGYCPNCHVKQVINEEGIAEFNKRSLEKIRISFFRHILNLFYCLKRLGRLRLRLVVLKAEPKIDGNVRLKRNSAHTIFSESI